MLSPQAGAPQPDDDAWVEAFSFAPTQDHNGLRSVLGSWLARRGMALADLRDEDLRVVPLPVPLSNPAGAAVSIHVRRSALSPAKPKGPGE
jgi:hypothetical protein